MGKVLPGGSVWTNLDGYPSGIDWLDTATGVKHVVEREYGDSPPWNWAKVDAILGRGRIPAYTTKFTDYTAAEIASGAADAAIQAQAQQAKARAPHPLWLEYYHEPEDNFSSDDAAAEFRAASRRIVEVFRSEAVANVAWVFPSWMARWSFDGAVASRGGAWKWDPDWKGTLSGDGVPAASDWYTGTESVVDILGFDTYTPTIGATTYHALDWDLGFSLEQLDAWGRPHKPSAILEMGTKDITPTPDWTAHYAAALETMVEYDVIGYVVYNVGDNNFITADPTGLRLAGYNAMVHDARVLGLP